MCVVTIVIIVFVVVVIVVVCVSVLFCYPGIPACEIGLYTLITFHKLTLHYNGLAVLCN